MQCEAMRVVKIARHHLLLLLWSACQAIYNMVDSSMAPGDEIDTPDKRTKEIFDKMDSNGDGVLSKDEFIQGCMADEFLCQMLTADPGPE